MRTEMDLNEHEMDLNEFEIDLNEFEHFLKANLDQSEIDGALKISMYIYIYINVVCCVGRVEIQIEI